MADDGGSTGPEPQRWPLVRGLLVLVLTAATAAASPALIGIGGFLLVPLVLIAGVVHSCIRSPVAWVCYGSLIVGLSTVVALSEDHHVGLLPAVTPLWVGVGSAGLAMIGTGYARILLRSEAPRRARTEK